MNATPPETGRSDDQVEEPQVLIFAEFDTAKLPPELRTFLTGMAMQINGKGTTYHIPSPLRGDPKPIVVHSDKPRLVEVEDTPSAISRVISAMREFLHI